MAVKTRNGHQAQEEQQAPPSPPEITLSFAGSGGKIEVSIWSNEAEKDGTKFVVYTTRLQRSYYEGERGKGAFKNTGSLRQGDLLVAAHALTEAYRWIETQKGDKPF